MHWLEPSSYRLPHKEIETSGDTDRSNIQDVMTRASFLFNEPT